MILDIPLNLVTTPIKLSHWTGAYSQFLSGCIFSRNIPHPWGKMILNAGWGEKLIIGNQKAYLPTLYDTFNPKLFYFPFKPFILCNSAKKKQFLTLFLIVEKIFFFRDNIYPWFCKPELDTFNLVSAFFMYSVTGLSWRNLALSRL